MLAAVSFICARARHNCACFVEDGNLNHNSDVRHQLLDWHDEAGKAGQQGL
jgi:hypothetical protein